MSMYSTSAFAKWTGLSPDTLRYYEKLGLLCPARNANGYRVYSEEDLRWVEFLQRLRQTDMPIRQMVRYAQPREQDACTMKERLSQDLQRLQQHLAALQHKIL